MPRRLISSLAALAVGTALAVAVQAPTAGAKPAVADSQGPSLTSFAAVPSTVAVRYAEGDAVLDLRIKDGDGTGLAGVGFDHGTVTLSNGSTSIGPADISADDLVGGNAVDGTYDIHLSAPQGTPAGSYTASISLTDVRNNTTTVTNTTSPLTVTSTTDTTAPTLSGTVTAGPASVDVTRGDRDITYGVHLLDAVSGVSDASLVIRDAAGHTAPVDLFQTSGTPQDGRWTGDGSFATTSTTGAWTVVSLTAHDIAGNTLNTTSGLGGSATVTRTADSTKPTLVGVTASPTAVTTTSSSADVKISVHATDNLSGVTYGAVTFTSPDGGDSVSGYFSGAPDSGSAADGSWRTQVTLPARAVNGAWTLTSAYLTDAQGNGTDYDAGTPPPAASIAVTTAADTTAPTMTGLSVGPATVPATYGSATIIGRFSVADAGSGFAGATISFKAPNGTVSAVNTTTLTDPSQYTLIGTKQNGKVSFPAYLSNAAPGTWTVASVVVRDLAGNTSTYSGAQLTGALSVTVAAAAADTTAPSMTSLAIATSTAADGGMDVTATLGVTDGGNAATGFASGSVVLSPPDNGPSLYFNFDGSRAATGDYETGTFVDTEHLARFSTPGSWRVASVGLWDNNWNSRGYDQAGVTSALGTAPALNVPDSSDTLAPNLTSITVDATADVTTGDPVVVHVTGSDDASGLASAAVTMSGPNGRTVSATGTVDPSTSGTAVDVNVNVPQYASTGSWSIGTVVLTDRHGNPHTYTATDLTAVPGNHSVSVTALDDTTAPTANGPRLSPTAVDTTGGDGAVDTLIHLTDNPAGVDTATLALAGPHGQTITTPLYMIAGTIYDGWWQGAINVPQFVESGAWTVDSLNVRDLGGNAVAMGAASLGSAAQLAVTGASDSQPPALTALSVTPATVDTAAGAQTVAVRAGAGDTQSGVASLTLTITAPNGVARTVDLQRSDSGAGGAATLVGALPIAADAPTGNWTVTSAALTDRYGNRASYTTSQLSGGGMSSGFTTVRSASTTPTSTPTTSTPTTTPAPSSSDPTTPAPSSSDPTTPAPSSSDPTTSASTPPPAVAGSLVAAAIATSTTYGTAVRVAAKLTRYGTTTPLVGRTVYLQWRPYGSTGAFHTVATPLRTSSYGWVTFTTFKPGYSVQLRLYAPATTGYLAAASGGHSVLVRRYLSAYAVTSAHRGAHFTVHGTVWPLSAGRQLYFQQWNGHSWSTITAPRLYHNAYSFTTYSWTRGNHAYRTAVTAYGGLVTTYSATKWVRIY